MDVFPKFIIEDGKIIISKCTFHKELATNIDKVQGGGLFNFNNNDNIFTFYGTSHDFGEAKIEDIKLAIESDKVFTHRLSIHSIATKYKFVYDTQSELIPLN